MSLPDPRMYPLAVVIGEVVPGYHLVHHLADAVRHGWPRWGLMNDPNGYNFDYQWTVDPLPDVDYIGNETEESAVLSMAYSVALNDFEDALVKPPIFGFTLVTACVEAGYDFQPVVAAWLMERMAKMIEASELVESR